MRLYDWDKLVCGLVDLADYAGVPEALAALRKTVAWASRPSTAPGRPADGHDFWGAGPGDTSEWYTLPENLYRAYLLERRSAVQGIRRRLALRRTTGGPSPRRPRRRRSLPVHAYSHVNSFCSAAAAYRVTGDARYRQICVNGYDFLLPRMLRDRRLRPGRAADAAGRQPRPLARRCSAYHAEIPCGSWAAFKLSTLPDALHRRGALRRLDRDHPLQRDGRQPAAGARRQAPLLRRLPPLGRDEEFYWHEWPCCSGTYLQNMAEYHNCLPRTIPAVYVNLYVPSEVTFLHEGAKVRLTLETDYPEAETATVSLSLEAPARFTLKFGPGCGERRLGRAQRLSAPHRCRARPLGERRACVAVRGSGNDHDPDVTEGRAGRRSPSRSRGVDVRAGSAGPG